jgi:transposase-like protein
MNAWGLERYQRETDSNRTRANRLLDLLNEHDLPKSRDVVTLVAEKLGIKPGSLRSRMSRRGIRRAPNGRYVETPRGSRNILTREQARLLQKAKLICKAERRTRRVLRGGRRVPIFSREMKIAAVKARNAGIPAATLAPALGIKVGTIYQWTYEVKRKGEKKAFLWGKIGRPPKRAKQLLASESAK